MGSKDEFESWLQQRGRSPRTASSYAGAVANKLSRLALDHHIIDVPLLDYSGNKPLERIVHEIRDTDVFKADDARGKGTYGAALRQFVDYRALPEDQALSDDLERLRTLDDVSETERRTLIDARIGQGVFRQSLIDLWGGCAATGYSFLPMLIASHIRPWNASSNAERLDPHNGLLLVPTIDKAFDRGYVSFQDDGRIMIAAELESPASLSIVSSLRVCVRSGNRDYLAYHREVCFRR